MLATLTEELDKLAAGACLLGQASRLVLGSYQKHDHTAAYVLACSCGSCHLARGFLSNQSQSANACKLLLSRGLLSTQTKAQTRASSC